MFLTILLIFTLCIAFVKWKLTYWKRKNVPCIDTWSIWGNMGSPISRKEFIGVVYANIYKKFKTAGKQHGGIYGMLSPQYIPIDRDIFMRILRSDFDHFQDRGIYYNEKDDPVSANLLAIGGQKWKTLRPKVSPAFTKAKIKIMFNIIMDRAKAMNLAIDNQKSVDIKNLAESFTIDVIGSCGFGIECNSFESEKSDFEHLRNFNIFDGSLWKRLLLAVASNFPNLGRALGIASLPKLHTTFFQNLTKAALAYRRNNSIERDDVFQTLMDLDNQLTANEISAQCFAFFLAGFRTSASAVAYCLYELSRNPEIQEKARKEILLVMSKYNGEITFEALDEMKYLEQVVNETLRKYPPSTMITRTCTKDYKVPNHNLIIEKGTTIVFPLLRIHHDEEYYPNPEKFDPDRFSEQNVHDIPKFSYLPFGEGPRFCIANTFAMIEIKKRLRFCCQSQSETSVALEDFGFIVTESRSNLVEHTTNFYIRFATQKNKNLRILDLIRLLCLILLIFLNKVSEII